MSMALAVVDKAMVVVELDPNILFVTGQISFGFNGLVYD
jgi:hypothetical protein